MTVAIRDADGIPVGTTFAADVCIVGGGPAGITVALTLAGTGISAILLESGGEREEPESQELNEGHNTGLPYYELDETRHRVLGGSSERWAGWCRPMDPSDFESRPWVSTPGWPISFDEMRPYYRKAARLCELDDVELWGTGDGSTSLPEVYEPPFIGNDVEIATWQGSPPTKFGKVYRDELESARNVTVYTHATAVEVLTDDAGLRATGVRAVSSDGARFKVEASSVVLCAGAIESARLLLASRRVRENGLGNDHDLVGRHFMEHPHLVTALLDIQPPGMAGRPFVDAVDKGFSGAKARLDMQRPAGTAKIAYVVNADRRRRDQLLNFSTHIRTVSDVSREDSEAYAAFKLMVNNLRSPGELVSQIKNRTIPEGASEQFKRVARGMPEITKVIYQEALKKPTQLALYTQCEQVPNPESRVTLDEDHLDASGLPRVNLDWKLSRIDKEAVVGAHEILAEQFKASGLGILRPRPEFLDDGPDWGPGLRGGHHHMGTLRMSVDPRHGVVDKHGRVHTVQDLYVGDSAVFATSGYANPLLTLVALARRLGEHLEARLA